MYIYLLINVCLRLRDISWVVCSCLPDGSHKQVIAWPHVSQKRIELINLGQFWFIRFAAGWHVAVMSLAYGSDLANRNGPVKSHQSTQFVGCLIQVWHRALAINDWMMNADFRAGVHFAMHFTKQQIHDIFKFTAGSSCWGCSMAYGVVCD